MFFSRGFLEKTFSCLGPAEAALGAATSILDHPDGTPGMLARRETQRCWE